MKINVDAGHGIDTVGKRTPPMPETIKINDSITIKKGEQLKEHIAAVGVANYLVQELKRCKIDTMQTGFNDGNPLDDIDQPLADRQKAVANGKCDYSVSIHFNAYGDGKTFNSAQGFTVYIHDTNPGNSKKLAEVISKHLAGGSEQKNRGVNTMALAMCNCNTLKVKGAVLIELAFMTNEYEATKLMASEAFWKEAAQEICKGICEYTGVKYVEEAYVPTGSITTTSAKKDIIWLQEKLNALLPTWFPKLTVDGIYGPKTRIAVLIYWDILGWGSKMTDDGRKIGANTINALAAGRKK